MKVSVILPFHNSESTLERAIQSILDQTYADFELILIDNNSTDNSSNIAIEASQDARIVLLKEAQQGVVHAANRGLMEAKGIYIARMDADDWSFPDRLEKQMDLLDAESSIGLVAGEVEYDGDNPKKGFIDYLHWINEVTEPEAIYLNQFVEFPIVNPSMMFRRELVEKYGDFREGDFPEDYEFFLRLQQGGVRMKKMAIPVLKWNDLPTRLTRSHNNYSEEAFDRIKSIYLAEWLKKNNLHHPAIWVWGAGKKARRKSSLLSSNAIEIKGYVEVNAKKNAGDRPVIHFEQLPSCPDRFIVSFVAKWGARKKICEFLVSKGWKEGVDFILAA